MHFQQDLKADGAVRNRSVMSTANVVTVALALCEGILLLQSQNAFADVFSADEPTPSDLKSTDVTLDFKLTGPAQSDEVTLDDLRVERVIAAIMAAFQPVSSDIAAQFAAADDVPAAEVVFTGGFNFGALGLTDQSFDFIVEPASHETTDVTHVAAPNVPFGNAVAEGAWTFITEQITALMQALPSSGDSHPVAAAAFEWIQNAKNELATNLAEHAQGNAGENAGLTDTDGLEHRETALAADSFQFITTDHAVVASTSGATSDEAASSITAPPVSTPAATALVDEESPYFAISELIDRVLKAFGIELDTHKLGEVEGSSLLEAAQHAAAQTWSADDEDNDVTLFEYGGHRFAIFQADKSDADFDPAGDVILPILWNLDRLTADHSLLS